MGEDGLVALVTLIWEQLGGKWLALVIVGSGVLHYTGILRFWFGARTSERAQLSKDQQDYIDDLQAEVDAQRKRRGEDAEVYAREIARLNALILDERERSVQLIQTNALIARGEARLRHALMNLCQYIAALRFQFERLGHRPPPFEAWRDLLDVDPVLAEELKKIAEQD
jgi:hypothetical protein